MKEQATYKKDNIEGITIRSMMLIDLDGAMRLSVAEGWNQTENDWRLFIEDPVNVCLLAERDNRVVATTTSINYANEQAWIGMVLVDKEYRGLGLSKSLLSRVLEKLSSFKSIKLDATAAGQPVYQKFGFNDEYLVSRMVNLSMKNVEVENFNLQVERIHLRDINEIIALDESVFGVKRKQLIEFLVRENPNRGWVVKRGEKTIAFALGRKGSRYFQVGPVVASSSFDAKVLISKSLEDLTQQAVVVDVLGDKTDLFQWLNSVGFTRQRDFVRMYKGENHFPGKTANLFLICGPEFG